MRVVLLSDTHGFVEPFVQALARSADCVVHAGDIGGLEVIEAVTPDRGKLVAVRGNNDWPESWPGAAKAGVLDLGEAAEVDLPGGLLAVEHGHRIWDTRHYHKRLRAKYPKARAIVYGHTHIPLCRPRSGAVGIEPRRCRPRAYQRRPFLHPARSGSP